MKFTELYTVFVKKRILLSIWLGLLVCTETQAQTRQVITYYDNARTQIKERYAISSSNPPVVQGAYESFYTNGKLRSKGTYQQGIPDGQGIHVKGGATQAPPGESK